MSAAAAAIWEIQWRRSTTQLAPVDTGGHDYQSITTTQQLTYTCHNITVGSEIIQNGEQITLS